MLFKKRVSNAEYILNELLRLINEYKSIEQYPQTVKSKILKRVGLDAAYDEFATWIVWCQTEYSNKDFNKVREYFGLEAIWTKNKILQVKLSEWVELYNEIKGDRN